MKILVKHYSDQPKREDRERLLVVDTILLSDSLKKTINFFLYNSFDQSASVAVFCRNDANYEFAYRYDFYSKSKSIQKVQKDYFEYVGTDYFCFGEDLFGNLFVVCLLTGKVFFYNHDTSIFEYLAKDINDFVSQLIDMEEEDHSVEDVDNLLDDFTVPDSFLKSAQKFKNNDD